MPLSRGRAGPRSPRIAAMASRWWRKQLARSIHQHGSRHSRKWLQEPGSGIDQAQYGIWRGLGLVQRCWILMHSECVSQMTTRRMLSLSPTQAPTSRCTHACLRTTGWLLFSNQRANTSSHHRSQPVHLQVCCAWSAKTRSRFLRGSPARRSGVRAGAPGERDGEQQQRGEHRRLCPDHGHGLISPAPLPPSPQQYRFAPPSAAQRPGLGCRQLLGFTGRSPASSRISEGCYEGRDHRE